MRTDRGGSGSARVLVWLLVAACAPPEDVSIDALGCDAQPDPRCDHPIDRLVIPRLRALGVELRDASPEEYCRRLLVDLWGRVPDPFELADCVLLPDAGARVDAAMSSPLYERTMRRAWGEVLGYDNFRGYSDAVVDLDALVGRLYSGGLYYDDFAKEAAVHSGFLGLHPFDEWPAALWQAFLGRPAREDETAAFAPLTSVFAPRFFCEGHVYWNLYQEILGEGLTPAEAELYTVDTCTDLARTDWPVNFCSCDPEVNAGGCASDVLGTPIALAGTCPNPAEPDDLSNLRRVDRFTPGESDLCPDGVRRPECRDRELVDDEAMLALEPLEVLPPATEAERAELAKIGAALALRDDFWEAAVDREARLLLGWWQTSFRRPETDMPELRRLLADRLRERGSLREIQRLILTSRLYVAPAEAPDVAGPVPDFAMAPTKLMAAETWLDSAATAVGEPSGVCDFRFVGREGYYDTSILDPALAEPMPPSFYDELSEDAGYHDFAIRLGGCNAEQRRPSLSSVGIAFTESELGRLLCAYGRSVVPDGWDGDLAGGARHVIASTLGRTLDDAEAALLVSDMEACIAAGPEVGCADAATALRWLCRRAMESAEFSTY
jgi:hypothetical protein